MEQPKHAPLPHLSRRDFLKLTCAAVVGVTLGELVRKLSIAPQKIEGTIINTKDFLLQYFREKGIVFAPEEIRTDQREIQIYNGVNLPLSRHDTSNVYKFYENLDLGPFRYRLTSDSKEVLVTPSVASWQKNGTMIIVPEEIHLPGVFARQQGSFSTYNEHADGFITLIRIPDKNEALTRYNFSQQVYAQSSLIVEAAHTSRYVMVEDNGLGLPILEQRFLTQEAFGNTFWYVLWFRNNGYHYSPSLFENLEFPSYPASDGRIHNLKAIPISESLFNAVPIHPFLT